MTYCSFASNLILNLLVYSTFLCWLDSAWFGTAWFLAKEGRYVLLLHQTGPANPPMKTNSRTPEVAYLIQKTETIQQSLLISNERTDAVLEFEFAQCCYNIPCITSWLQYLTYQESKLQPGHGAIAHYVCMSARGSARKSLLCSMAQISQQKWFQKYAE